MNMEPVFIKIILFFLVVEVAESINTFYMDKHCNELLEMPDIPAYQMRLKRTSRTASTSKLDCVLRIGSTARGERLMLYFQSMDIESSRTCSNNWLEVFDGTSTTAPFMNGLYGKQCGYVTPRGVYTTAANRSQITLNFHSDSSWQFSGFDIIITRYHTGTCQSGEYECYNKRCIHNDIRCDGYDPCGDHSGCPELLAAGAVAAIVVGSICVCVFVTIMAVLCRRRRRRRYRAGAVTVQSTIVDHGPTYGTQAVGYNQPVPQQYPAYTPGKVAPSYPQ